MVVREVIPALSEVLGREAIAHNCSVFQGQGQLGKEFARALRTTAPYAGVCYVETLVHVSTGKIEEILQPDPTRSYEREVVSSTGERRMIPVSLSSKHPAAKLAVFIIDAVGSNFIIDVIARDEITPTSRATLRESIAVAKGEFLAHAKAA